jgi:hypothetical protein
MTSVMNADPKVMSMVIVMKKTVGPLSTEKEFSEANLEEIIEGRTRPRSPGKPVECHLTRKREK